MLSSAKRILIGIMIVCAASILAGCEPGQSFGRFTAKNISKYTAYFPQGFWDDGKTEISPGEEKTITLWWLDSKEDNTEGFQYTINGEVVEHYNIPLHHKEHITVIIKAPGPDGYEILRETDTEL